MDFEILHKKDNIIGQIVDHTLYPVIKFLSKLDPCCELFQHLDKPECLRSL